MYCVVSHTYSGVIIEQCIICFMCVSGYVQGTFLMLRYHIFANLIINISGSFQHPSSGAYIVSAVLTSVMACCLSEETVAGRPLSLFSIFS